MCLNSSSDRIVPSNDAHLKSAANANQRKAKGERQARMRAKVFTREQLFLFLQTPYECAPDYFGLFFLLARKGLRIGEAIALQIGDVDF